MFFLSSAKKNAKSAIRVNLILMIGIMLSFNAFAWFVYSTGVSNTITTKVKAWRIDFENTEGTVVEYITFNIDALYPGMPPYHNTINIVNYGESEANLEFELQSVKILDNTYVLGDYTQQELLDMLELNYPFSIVFTIANIALPAGNGTSDFEVDVVWPFESGDDTVDTHWGHQA